MTICCRDPAKAGGPAEGMAGATPPPVLYRIRRQGRPHERPL